MLEPNFSESQLQNAANSAYAKEVWRRNGTFPFPFVPSLPAEFSLGWDTAFDLGWLLHRLPPRLHYRHKGCNFFLQYKLSNLTDGPTRSKEWSVWNNSYFRFRIPHRKKCGNRYNNDFHQWERLKEIANAGIRACYATNTMVEEFELRSLYENDALLARIALLDVATIKRKHVHVSFVSPLTGFALHSKPEEAAALTFSGLLETLKDAVTVSFEDGVDQLTSIAARLSSDDEPSESPGIREQLATFQQEYLTQVGREGLPQFKRAILEAFFIRRFGLTPYWYPAGI